MIEISKNRSSQIREVQKDKSMSRLKLIWLCLLVFVTSIVFSQAKDKILDEKSLKVMSYNIWNGFDWAKDEDRHQKFIDWINSKKPDVLALQELCGYTQEKLASDAKKWGHDYAIILKEKGYPVGLTSNKPIVLKEKSLDGLWHGMLHAETWGFDFFVVHLSPSDRNFRYKEGVIIGEKIQNIKNKNYIVLGDFNAHSPYDGDQDKVDESHLKKVRASDVKNKKHNNLLDDQFDYSVISSFLSLPLIDVTPRFVSAKDRFTFPAEALVGTSQTKESVVINRVRIDYILTSRGLGMNCSGVEVFNGEDTTLLSDHFPLMATFKFDDK